MGRTDGLQGRMDDRRLILQVPLKHVISGEMSCRSLRPKYRRMVVGRVVMIFDLGGRVEGGID